MKQAGAIAPEITAQNQHGETIEPSFEKPTVLYFYPKDDTPGCTTEAMQFETERETYEEAGVEIYGVSMDDVDSHQTFAQKHGIEFDLLADPDAAIANAFGLPVGGGTTSRTTFVLADSEIYRVYESVSPDGHARDLLLELLDDGLVELE